MEKVNTNDYITELLNQSTSDWSQLCTSCQTLIKEANMTNEDIDKIVKKVKLENG